MDEAPGLPLIPSEEFVTAVNLQGMANGQPFRGALDPLMMLAWANATAPLPWKPIGLPAI